MKREVSPAMAIGIIAVLLAAVGGFWFMSQRGNATTDSNATKLTGADGKRHFPTPAAGGKGNQ